MVRLEIERELEIGEAEILSAAAAERGTDAVQHFGGAGLRILDQRRQFLAVLDLFHLCRHERMTRQRLFEGSKDFERLVLGAVARQEAAISFDDPQIGASSLCTFSKRACAASFLRRDVEDQSGMQVLENRIPVGPLQAVDRLDCGLGIVAPYCVQAISRAAVRSVTGPRTDCAS